MILQEKMTLFGPEYRSGGSSIPRDVSFRQIVLLSQEANEVGKPIGEIVLCFHKSVWQKQ